MAAGVDCQTISDEVESKIMFIEENRSSEDVFCHLREESGEMLQKSDLTLPTSDQILSWKRSATTITTI